jgi:hypothetical protein
MLIDYIYLDDLMLLEAQGLSNELVDLYKLAKKYGIKSLENEVGQRLQMKLSGISVESTVESGVGNGKKKYKAGNVINAVGKLAEIYENAINESSIEKNKILLLPSGMIVILDETKYNSILEEGIQLSLPDNSSATRIFLCVV